MYRQTHNRTLSTLASAAATGAFSVLIAIGLQPALPPRVMPERVLSAIRFVPPVPPERRASPPHRENAGARAAAGGSATGPAAHAEPFAPPLLSSLPPVPPAVIVLPMQSVPVTGNGAAAGVQNGGGGETGGSGNGTGRAVGDGADVATVARLIKGRLSVGDLIDSLFPEGADAHVRVRVTVGTDGRATACAIAQSSGQAAFDARVCALIVRRFRFAPAIDRNGHPVVSTVEQNHEWFSPKR